MKTVILAGGIGSRISGETYLKHKPMIEIGGNQFFGTNPEICGKSKRNEYRLGLILQKSFSQ